MDSGKFPQHLYSKHQRKYVSSIKSQKSNMDYWLVQQYRGNHGTYYKLESAVRQQKLLSEGCPCDPDYDVGSIGKA